MSQPFAIPNSQALYQRACQSLSQGVSSGLRKNLPPAPLYFERGEGAYFFDVDGHTLLDYTLAWGPLILGNQHAGLNAAVVEQLGKGYAFGAQHRGEIELAELMLASVPGLERVIFSNTGTEAVQAALRIARAATGRDKIVKFEGHYHGWQNNVLVSYRPKINDPIAPLPTCGGQPAHEFADTLVCAWNDLAALEQLFAEHPGQIAAVITEPLLANSGCCVASREYLIGIIELCRRHGAVSIFDEVITGFRLALGGAREYFQVDPDLSVYAKALAAGFALSAVGGKARVFAALEAGKTIHAGTYNGNPINIAAGIATIRALSAPGVYAGMHAHGEAIQQVLRRAAAAHQIDLVTCGSGVVFSAHFGLTEPPRSYRDYLHADMARYGAFRLALLSHGVQVLPDGRWYVGAAHHSPELELATHAIERAFEEIAR